MKKTIFLWIYIITVTLLFIGMNICAFLIYNSGKYHPDWGVFWIIDLFALSGVSFIWFMILSSKSVNQLK